MYTRCPHCSTLYLIPVEQLENTGGKTRCCRCAQPFNTIENACGLTAVEAPDNETHSSDNEGRRPATKTQPDKAADDKEGAPLILLEEMICNEQTPLATKYEAAHQDSPIRETTGNEALPGEETPAPESNSRPVLPPESPLAPHTKQHAGSACWILGSFGLLALLLAQLGWFGRDTLSHYPYAQTLAQKICAVAGCRIPPHRDPARIQLLRRELSSHPEVENALLLRLVIFNDAPFPQPYPRFELSLFSTNQQLIARRLFAPAEYLGKEIPSGTLMPSNNTQYVEMELEDPGKDVSGFQFDFL